MAYCRIGCIPWRHSGTQEEAFNFQAFAKVASPSSECNWQNLMHYRKSVSKDKIKRVKPLAMKHYCILVRLWLKTKVRGA